MACRDIFTFKLQGSEKKINVCYIEVFLSSFIKLRIINEEDNFNNLSYRSACGCKC